MNQIRSTLPCNLDTQLLLASMPLFEADGVQAIEWSFDTVFNDNELPDWFRQLLATYSDAGRLVGHGVFFSLFSGRWLPEHEAWLAYLKRLSATYSFDHISEHFGFMTGADFHQGAPLSIPLTKSTLAIGHDRLGRIQEVAGCPVGVENLAFAYSLDEVKRQGDFLHQLIEPVNGFLILDLHNLYCQSQNFRVNDEELIATYPLDRVREIHISGGSWQPSAIEHGRSIRRDTHDHAVPDEVFMLLKKTIGRCQNLRYVVLEQLGSGLFNEQERLVFSNDFWKMDQIVQMANQQTQSNQLNRFLPLYPLATHKPPLDDKLLFEQQRHLSLILETASDYQQALMMLATSGLAQSAWQVEQWEPVMLETALSIAQTWRHGFAGLPDRR